MGITDILQKLHEREYYEQRSNLGLSIAKYSDGFTVDYWERKSDNAVSQAPNHLGCFYPLTDYPKSVTDAEFETIHHATKLTKLAMDCIINHIYNIINDKKIA